MALPEVREWTGGPLLRSGSGREAFLAVREDLTEVRELSEGLPGGPGLVGRPSWRSGRPTQRSSSGREPIPKVRDAIPKV